MLVSQPIQLTRENDRRRKQSRASDLEWEIGIPGCKLAGPSRSSAAARPTIGAFEAGLHRQGRRRTTRSERAGKGVVGKGWTRKMVEGGGGRAFMDAESGGWPVHAPCPTERSLNPGGTTPQSRL